MSMIFGMTMKAGKPQYSGLQLQSSAANVPVPIVWGRNRVAPNLIWYGDFAAVKKKQKSGKGGVTTEFYEYYVSVEMGLCEGEIVGAVKVWKDQSHYAWTDVTNPFTLFTGTDPQTPWGYLTTKHPDQALGYPTVAYAAVANYDLGQSANLGQHSFEIKAISYNTAPGGEDADCALVVDSFLTSTQFGTGFPAASMDYAQILSGPNATTTGDSTYQTYCRAIGFGLSPALVSQEQALNILDRWSRLTNSAPVWNGDKLKIIPYGDETITANGVTFLPNISPVATLSYDDYLGDSGSDPLTVTRSDPAEAYNSFKIEIRDRDFEYNNTPLAWKDQNLIELYGLREQSNYKAEEVTSKAIGSIMVSLMGQRLAYIRNEYQFRLGPNFILLEPMDIVLATDPGLGAVYVRILTVEEDESGQLSFTAEEFNEGVGSNDGFGTQPGLGNGQNRATVPGSVNTPIIWEPPLSLSNGVNQVWAAISGGDGTTEDPNWGGAMVYLSIDNVTYQEVGMVDTPATMGKLTASLASYGGANPDTTHTMSIDLSMSGIEIDSVTATEAINNATLSYVGGEYLSYEDVALTSTLNYDVTTLYRALFGSTASSHASGTDFVRCNDALFKYDLPAGYVGQTIYLKFQSFNIWGQAFQDIADCVAYTYVPTGGGVPNAPGGFIGTGGYQQISLSWYSDSTGTVTGYDLYAYHGTTTDFGLATLLASPTLPGYFHVGLANTDTWTYWVKAKSIGGTSAASGPLTVTTITP